MNTVRGWGAACALAASLVAASACAQPSDPFRLPPDELARRIALDFPYTRADVRAQLEKQIDGVLTDEEFDAWDRAGLLEHTTIDGERRYFARAASNLFRLSPEALARRKAELGPLREGPLERPHAHHRAILEGPVSQRVRITQSITVKPDAVPAGETIRAWIPYPRAIEGQQTDLRKISTQPTNATFAPESAPMRTVYFEQKAKAGEPATFQVSYELTVHAQHHAIEAEKVQQAPATAALAEHLGERPPHIVFTPEIRAYSQKVVGDEKNPYRIAQKLFAAVDRDFPWAGAREYSTIANIPQYVLEAKHADCGQQTLLLMTLLRLNGIPARWQSGWVYSDTDYDTMHDWGYAYFAPYGWVPMDVTFGPFDVADEKLRWFYLGSLDAWRVAYNDDYGRAFVPAKTHPRSETVDSQRGEVEWKGGNLYFDQWDYHFAWQLLPREADQ